MSENEGGGLTEELLTWAGVTRGLELQLNGNEIGHLHGNRLFDLFMPKSERDRWIEEGEARPHHIYPDSGWVSVYLIQSKTSLMPLKSRVKSMIK